MTNIIKYINNDAWEDALNNLVDITDTIFDGNNILHVACIRGKTEIINKLKTKLDLGLGNDRGETCLHLLFRNGWDEIAQTIYEEFPSLLGSIDAIGRTPIMWVTNRSEVLLRLIDTIIKLKMTDIFDMVTFDERTLVLDIIDKSDNLQYLNILKKLLPFIDMSKPTKSPVIHYCIIQSKYSALKLLIDFGADIEQKDDRYMKPINIACGMNRLEAVKILLDNNVDLSYGGPENDYLPVNIAINGGLYDMLQIMYKHIKDFDVIDRYLNLYIHYILYKIQKGNTIDKEILKYFIERSNMSKKNIDGLSPSDLMLKPDKTYKISESVEHNITESELSPQTPIKSLSSKKVHGLFNSDIVHNVIYTAWMMQTYKDLTCPYKSITNKTMKHDNRSIELQNIQYDKNYSMLFNIVDVYYKFFSYLTPHIIVWRNKRLYFVHPEFTSALKKCFQNDSRFILIKISLIPNTNGTHANIVLIDKKKNDVRRFEPYGVTYILDGYFLDKMISNYIKLASKAHYKYYKPNDYLEDARFQTVSNDTYTDDKKLGDPTGYCLAWCFWYIELKLCNPDIDEKTLITSAIIDIKKKYGMYNNPYLMFIREYGTKLDSYKNSVLKVIGIDEINYYDISYKYDVITLISSQLKKHFDGLLL